MNNIDEDSESISFVIQQSQNGNRSDPPSF